MFVGAATWTVAELEHAVAASRSLTDVLRRLGLRPAGDNFKSIAGWIDRLEFPTSHFDSDTSRGGPRPWIPLSDILVEHSTYKRTRLKERLYAEGIKQRRCELCGQGELWRGRLMSLTIDHINGVSDDHRIENLRIVCPNCAATLDTHCGRNSALEVRSCELCKSPFRPRASSQRFCSHACGCRAPKPFRGKPRPERRKVQRPSREVLLDQMRSDGFLATGRRYGVSDNAIRKWLVWFDREAALAAEQQRRPGSNA